MRNHFKQEQELETKWLPGSQRSLTPVSAGMDGWTVWPQRPPAPSTSLLCCPNRLPEAFAVSLIIVKIVDPSGIQLGMGRYRLIPTARLRSEIIVPWSFPPTLRRPWFEITAFDPATTFALVVSEKQNICTRVKPRMSQLVSPRGAQGEQAQIWAPESGV